MAIPNIPPSAENAPWGNIVPTQGTVVRVTTTQTNTATSATQIIGVTNTFTIQPGTNLLKVYLTADSVSNSGANNVIVTAWNGVVGSGTQFGQSTTTAQSGAKQDVDYVWFLTVTGAMWNTSVTINVGMHGSGAGTNTMAAASTYPITMVIDAE